ncbi:MAG: ATP-binding cassette domain-containing protein [Geminicoccaceae bacterium]
MRSNTSSTCAELLERPQHPYLRALLHAVPRLHTHPDERLTSIREVKVDAAFALDRNGGEPVRRNANRRILEVAGLRKVFLTRKVGWLGGEGRQVIAVDDVGFAVDRGETLAIVGESGSGKTTVSKMIMRAVRPDDGRIIFHSGDGPVDVLALDEAALQGFRRHIQYIFQDPFGSLDPRMTVADIIAEPLLIHGIGNEGERLDRVKRLLQAVGLDVRHMRRYPHSFSGGQRQRVGIARALALEPEILICDEPVSALDVSVQAQILNLLKDLQSALGLTYLFISHNLAVVKYLAQRIAVMCAGRMVELAPTDRLFDNPQHPYTKTLLAAVPEPDLHNPLDFAALASGRSSEPEQWPEPFTLVDGSGHFREVEPGHFVRFRA